MHLEVRKVKRRKRYYLAHSYRLGSKIRKIRVYLGTDLSKEEQDAKAKAAEARIKETLKTILEIRSPYLTVLSKSELKQLKDLNFSIPIKLQHLSEKDWLKFTETFTYDTNAIEGSTIERAEVKGILEKESWPDKSKEEIWETQGVADAIKYIRSTKETLSLELIKELHRHVFKNSKNFAGKLRKPGEEVVVIDRAGNVIHRGAPQRKVLYLLLELIKWYKDNSNVFHPVVLAAVVHNQFETIHPFRDGNGRVGRLLLLNILIKHGLPPLNIELKKRKEYYSILQTYQKTGDIRPTIEFFLKEYKRLKKIIR